MGWWSLYDEATCVGGMRTQSLMSNELQPHMVTNMEAVGDAMDRWEVYVRNYQQTQQHPVSDASLIFSIKLMVPQEFENVMHYKSTVITTYVEVKTYVIRYVTFHRITTGAK